MADITWVQALQLLLQMFRSLLADNIDMADGEIDKLMDAFIDALSPLLRSKFQAENEHSSIASFQTCTSTLEINLAFSQE